MKKLILSLALLTALATTSFAQLSVGIKGGLNLATLGGDAEDVDMRPSIHLGGYLNLPLSDQLSFQPELLYSGMGGKEEESGNDSGVSYSAKVTTKLSYISIPLNLQYSFGAVNVHVGPQLSFLASAKNDAELTYTFGGVTETESEETDIKDQMNGLDLGINFGLGVEFGKLNVTGRYVAGLSNIVDTNNDDMKVTNSLIQLSLGYRLFGGE